ncbi:MAG TPA: flagellar filament outer layer protein FlaA [Spirochaetota bacterium]|nr:flagellar filament outer layer protein FlaA [Spirochaetota bacterium]HPF06830.1 flagellar filament outer layer protein FlaA [Spirochaetota bacterium]HPJ43269.1 flagellar filament outer layer protein FlaA [Spirochaetota bacterium]HRX48166.1 flagellar filament outer layer protein FlaA [Spirochaetota bacterium]
MNSIRNRIFIVTICLTAAFIVAFGINGYSRIETNVPADLSGEETRAIVIEDFEASKIAGSVEEDGWYLTSNPKVYTKAKDEETLKKKNPVMALDLKYVDGGPNDMKVEDAFSITGLGKEKKKILGLKFRFRYPGSNVVTIEAPKEVDWKERNPVVTYDQALRQDVQERGLQIPGRAKAISLWVHGRGFPYTLELWIKDFRGDVHILEKQSINFVGWRPMIFDIPQNIPQSTDSYPVTRTSKLVRLVIREVTSVSGEHSRTSSRNASDVYVFFDQIKVLTDTYEVFFDGQDMHKAFEGGSSSNQKTQ